MAICYKAKKQQCKATFKNYTVSHEVLGLKF